MKRPPISFHASPVSSELPFKIHTGIGKNGNDPRSANKTMKSKAILILGAIAIALVGVMLKLVYFGWVYQDYGKHGEYVVRAYQTLHHIDPRAVFVNDAAGGYYRVFDKNGDKVFEAFSAEFAFDIVIPGKSRLEIQFARGDTLVWKPGHFASDAESTLHD
jgi:hypothetical protein